MNDGRLGQAFVIALSMASVGIISTLSSRQEGLRDDVLGLLLLVGGLTVATFASWKTEAKASTQDSESLSDIPLAQPGPTEIVGIDIPGFPPPGLSDVDPEGAWSEPMASKRPSITSPPDRGSALGFPLDPDVVSRVKVGQSKGLDEEQDRANLGARLKPWLPLVVSFVALAGVVFTADRESSISEADLQQQLKLRSGSIDCRDAIVSAIDDALVDLAAGRVISRDAYFEGIELEVCGEFIDELQRPDNGDHWVTPFAE